MIERVMKVETIRIHKMCDCGAEFTCIDNVVDMLLGNGKYTHRCKSCGKTAMFDKVYPLTQEIESPVELHLSQNAVVRDRRKRKFYD